MMDRLTVSPILSTCSWSLYKTEKMTELAFHTSLLHYHMEGRKADATVPVACDLRGIPYSFSLSSHHFLSLQKATSPSTRPVTLPACICVSFKACLVGGWCNMV